MEHDRHLYSIGEVAELCHVSRKTLRYYEQVGVLMPDEVGANSYRYYDRNSLLSVPVIRYYKQMGFRLEELRQMMERGDLLLMSREFQAKLREHEEMEREIFRMKQFISDWFDLVNEAQVVLASEIDEVSIKIQKQRNLLAMDDDFNYDYKEATINIGFTNFVSEIGNAITGPVMIHYPSWRDKRDGTCNKMQIVQQPFLPPPPEATFEMRGGAYISTYHSGPYEGMYAAYDRIETWADTYGYRLADHSIERYVCDHWSTSRPDIFVTEILIPAEKIK